jgi:hypothetical protein
MEAACRKPSWGQNHPAVGNICGHRERRGQISKKGILESVPLKQRLIRITLPKQWTEAAK